MILNYILLFQVFHVIHLSVRETDNTLVAVESFSHPCQNEWIFLDAEFLLKILNSKETFVADETHSLVVHRSRVRRRPNGNIVVDLSSVVLSDPWRSGLRMLDIVVIGEHSPIAHGIVQHLHLLVFTANVECAKVLVLNVRVINVDCIVRSANHWWHFEMHGRVRATSHKHQECSHGQGCLANDALVLHN